MNDAGVGKRTLDIGVAFISSWKGMLLAVEKCAAATSRIMQSGSMDGGKPVRLS